MSIEDILKEELDSIKLAQKEKLELKHIVDAVIKSLDKKLEKLKIKAEVFIGGSLAKNTIIKKQEYDIDLFLRFNKDYSEENMKKQFKKIFWWFKVPEYRTKAKLIHGSRDYCKISLKSHKNICIEIIPVLDIKSPEQARNVTDLSYFHVNYVKKQLKLKPEVIDQILLAKAFCYGQKCYGAESYVNGFSGYALELLIIYYGSFIKFLNEIVNYKQKVIIDPVSHYKSAEEVIKNLNPAKIQSPIILIDPTFKERNVTSALSNDTFHKFRESAARFLKEPSIDFFISKQVDINELKRLSLDKDGIFVVIELKTNKQPGDIAGTKLLKSSKFLSNEINKGFDITKHDFEYNGLNKARAYYILQRKKQIVVIGSSIHYKEAVEGFKKAHPVWYIQGGRIFSAKPTDINFDDFLKQINKTNKKTIKEMSIRRVKLITRI